MKRKHNSAPNCQCYECTNNDPYISHLRAQFGKNAAHFDSALNGGVSPGYKSYNHFSDTLSIAPVKTTTLSPVPVVTGTQTTQSKANLKTILGDALGGIVGDLVQAKKDGEQLPKVLDVVASLGIKTEQAAIDAAQKKAESETGKLVLGMSPYIVGGILLAFGVLIFFILKKK